MTRKTQHRQAGLTLIEVMIALVILTFGIVGFIGSFSAISRSIRVAKARTLATNLAQEQIESLKNLSYYRLLVTTATAVAAETGVSGYSYDIGNYPPETLTVGQIQFTRRTLVQKVAESGGAVTVSPWSDADTGLKQITSTVIWREGDNWRKVQVTNLRDNPNRPTLDATLQGKVKSGGVAIQGVSVYTLQNLLYSGVTSATGDYSFKVPAGTYDVFAKKRGYFEATTQSSVTASGTTNIDFNMTQMGVGSIAGIAYIADHIVLDEVCAAVGTDDNLEYVELYNPKSTPVTMYASGPAYQIEYKDEDGNLLTITPPSEIFYVNTQIPANGYFLIASSPIVNGVLADAYYYAGGPISLNKIPIHMSGGLKLVSQGVNEATGTVVDAIGWGRGSAPYAPDGYREGTGLLLAGGPGHNGLELGETIERMAYSTSTHTMMDTSPTPGIHHLNGNGYDTNLNNFNWVHHNHSGNETPQNSLMAEAAGAATPAGGASIFSDDGISASATALSVPVIGSFTVTNVATGSCTVLVSTRGYAKQISNVAVTIGAQTQLGSIIVDQPATTGFLYGTVYSGGVGVGNITVVTSNGLTDVTDSAGDYKFQVIEGTHVVTANPNNINQTYTEESTTGTFVAAGSAAQVEDLQLQQGGTIRGFVSTNGVDPLPNIPVIATNTTTGIEVGTVLSDVYGRYTFPNLPNGSYSLTPQLESGETATPSALSATVTTGSSVFAGTTTVSNAFGTIQGTVSSGSNSITTGVLLVAVAQPNTISGTSPPTNNQVLRNGSVVYYTASAESDGTYSIPVRGGSTYNVYAWYTTFSGTTPTVVKKAGTAAVAAGGTTTVDFTW